MLNYIAEHYESPLQRHARFMADGKLQYNQVGASEHQVIMQILHYAATYDQLDVSQLVSMELLARRAQMIELKYKHKFALAGSSGDGADPYEDAHLYMGLSETRNLLCVCPALERSVGAELKDEAKLLESRRKAHEERAALGKKK